jgi:Sec-independent protein secretion pathway component TatC
MFVLAVPMTALFFAAAAVATLHDRRAQRAAIDAEGRLAL